MADAYIDPVSPIERVIASRSAPISFAGWKVSLILRRDMGFAMELMAVKG